MCEGGVKGVKERERERKREKERERERLCKSMSVSDG
jgi:hypothetical protein